MGDNGEISLVRSANKKKNDQNHSLFCIPGFSSLDFAGKMLYRASLLPSKVKVQSQG